MALRTAIPDCGSSFVSFFQQGAYPFALSFPVVPGSDGAGEVVEVGSKVAEFKKGDQVATLFNQGHQYGEIDPHAAATGLGGAVDGTLREYAVFNETGLVKAPANLTAQEASTLPCAALTSWNALYGLKPLKPGQVVLVQGTGGVSIFGLQVRSNPIIFSGELKMLMSDAVRQGRGRNSDCDNLLG